ncbi:MAG: hypothetical protein ACPGEF_06515 [Endozoicomonas sp.]
MITRALPLVFNNLREGCSILSHHRPQVEQIGTLMPNVQIKPLLVLQIQQRAITTSANHHQNKIPTIENSLIACGVEQPYLISHSQV